MGYSVNGVAIDNPAKDWTLVSGSKLRSEQTRSVMSLAMQGRDGVLRGMPSDAGPAPITLVVGTPSSRFGELFALIGYGGVLTSTEWAGREAVFEYLSHTVVEDEATNDWLQVSFVLRIPGVYWRDVVESTSSAASLSSASVNVDVFAGISGVVQDAVIRVKGATTGLQVTDLKSGSWFAYAPALTTSQYLRFESATGRAFVTSSNVWTGGTEVSGDIDFGGWRGLFEIAPYWTVPETRVGRLVVATATRNAATLEVRGKNAYVV